MRVIWTPQAERDRNEIFDFIAADDARAADRLDHLFETAVARLEILPSLGRLGAVPGTRELIPHENYRLIYQIHNDAAWILSILHVARQWPPAEE